MQESEVPPFRLRVLLGSLCIGAAALAMGLIGYAVWLQTISPLRGAYLILLSALLAVSFRLFLGSMMDENRLSFESNWGGLGGGLGGWRISASVTYLLITMALFALLVAAVNAESPMPDLRERYRAAVNVGVQKGIKFEKREMLGRRLYLKGSAPNQAAANAFWDEVKLTNPFHDDIRADLTIAPAAGASAK